MTNELPDSLAAELVSRLSASPDAYPQKIDLIGLNVLVIEFNESAYRGASFLDDRVFGATTKGAWLPVDRVAEAARVVVTPRPLHFIFHTGHVGSTLVSRLLDQTGAVLPLREPLPLRTLADASDGLARLDSLVNDTRFAQILAMFMQLWARGYEATRAVVIKATSSAGRLAGRILAAGDRSRAIYLNLRLEPYLATLLAGRNSPVDLRGHGPERIRRLQSRSAAPFAPLHALSIGELAAMSWLVESWTQRDAMQRFPARILAIDFEAFLASPDEDMRRITAHFELPVDERYYSEVGTGPAMTRYSKAPEYPYTPAIRGQVLDDSRRHNREEIRKGIVWLERMARVDNAIAELVHEKML